MNKAVLVFIKNPQLGEAKTRLAKTMGDVKALELYKKLLRITHDVVKQVEANRMLFYSKHKEEDFWSEDYFQKHIQSGGDLGDRMKAAFEIALKNNDNVVIIGSDCPEISAEIMEEAFLKLENHDVVIGPSEDGGYYLLGINQLRESLLTNIPWSTEKVLETTIEKILQDDLTLYTLPMLNDIDTEEDLIKSGLSY